MSSPAPKHRLLVVDDDPAALLICKTHLQKAGYEVELASSVAKARTVLKHFGAEGFMAVFTDYRMPVENGLVLLKHITDTDPTLSVIIMTAESEKTLIMSSLREGAHNFIEKPLTKTVLIESAESAIGVTRRNRMLAADANAARAVGSTQQLLLGHANVIHNDVLSIRFHPHERAGGDFVATFQLSPERYIVLVSDVSGHDLGAAYQAAYLQGLARGLLQCGTPLNTVFQQINTILLDDWNGRQTIDLSLAACGISVDCREKTLTLLNCGLPNPVVSDRRGWTIDNAMPGASPLGWFKELPPAHTIQIGEGFLQFWSDGLEDLADQLSVCPLSLSYLLHHDNMRGREYIRQAKDDIIFGIITLDPANRQTCAYPLIAETYRCGDEIAIDEHQNYFERSIRLALPDISDDTMVKALLCLREGLLNALVHGCAGKTGLEASIKLSYSPTTSSLHLSIRDGGSGHDFDIKAHEAEGTETIPDEHRGLIMMKHLSRNLTLSHGGSHLTMEIPVNAA